MTILSPPRPRTEERGFHPGLWHQVPARVLELARHIPAVALLILVVALVWPVSLGGRFGLVIVGGSSMEPTYQVGDVLVTWRMQPEPGDVITYRIPADSPAAGRLVVHRIIGGDPAGWITQGDNVDHPDPWKPTSGDVLGVARWRLPAAGHVLPLLRSPLTVSILAGLLAALLLWPSHKGAHER